MPTMPFHLEKGKVIGALEALINARPSDPAKFADLQAVYADLFTHDLTIHAALAKLDAAAYPGLHGALDKWFDNAGGYWTPQYDPARVDDIATAGIKFALGRAWGGGDPLPPTLPTTRDRDVHVWWFCAQRWFDTWITWESDRSPINLYFATPPHTTGEMVENMTKAVNDGLADDVAPLYGKEAHDMVLIGATRHKEKKAKKTSATTSKGECATPQNVWVDKGKIGAWSITLDGGGMP